MDNKPWEQKLKEALILVEQSKIKALEKELESKEEFQFSKEFQDKMQTLIDSIDNKNNNIDKTKISNLNQRKLSIKKKALIIIAAIVLVMSMILTAEGNREAIAKMIMEITNKFKNITFESEEELINSIREEYIPSYIPKGYTLISENTMNSIRKVIYENEKGVELEFMQIIPSGTKIGIENEDIVEKNVKINDIDGILIENINSQRNLLYWYNERYALIITGEMSEIDMIAIAESVKLKEK